MWYRHREPVRKPPALLPSANFGPWSSVRFPSKDARDEFLGEVPALSTGEVQVEVVCVPGEDHTVQVRWRPGQFLRLNDVAYAHGGRLIHPMGRGRGA